VCCLCCVCDPQPCAFVHIRSIGKISAEKNPATVKALTETVASELHVAAGRVFITLDDIAPYNWGMDGQVF
jgi:phenylpyruvate tautomerase PptA (4-oxalocrotonate tautomerase family)